MIVIYFKNMLFLLSLHYISEFNLNLIIYFFVKFWKVHILAFVFVGTRMSCGRPSYVICPELNSPRDNYISKEGLRRTVCICAVMEALK